MNTVDVVVKLGKGEDAEILYKGEAPQFESLSEAVEKIGETKLLKYLNSRNATEAASQGKGAYLKILGTLNKLRENSDGSPASVQAIKDAETELETAQRKAIGKMGRFILGRKGRGRSSGPVTQAKQREFGAWVTQYMVDNGKLPTQKEQDEMLARLGIADAIKSFRQA